MKPSTTIAGWVLPVLVAVLLVPAAIGAVARSDERGDWQGERDYGLFTPSGEIAVPVVAPIAVEAPSGYDWAPIVLGVAIVSALAVVVGATILTRRAHGGPGRPVPH